MDKSKLLMSSSKNFTSKQRDPQLERNKARLALVTKHLHQDDDNSFEEGNAPEQEP
jgi:hypothetical protein